MAYAANYIPTVFPKKTMKIFDEHTVWASNDLKLSLVNRQFEPDLKKAGQTINVRSFGDITIRNYTREGDLTLDTLTDPNDTMTVAQEKYFAYLVDDVDEFQSDVEIMNGYAKRAAIAIRNTVDQHCHAIAYANAAAANIIGTSSSPITLTKDSIYNYVIDMKTNIKNSNGSTENLSLVIDPTREGLLAKAPQFTHATELGDKTIRNGYLGMIAGVKVHCSTNLNSVTGNVPLVMCNPEFMTFVMQINKTKFADPSLKFTSLFKGLYVYQADVLSNYNVNGAVLWAAGT